MAEEQTDGKSFVTFEPSHIYIYIYVYLSPFRLDFDMQHK